MLTFLKWPKLRDKLGPRFLVDIQKFLSGHDLPPFIQSMSVTTLEFGDDPPEVKLLGIIPPTTEAHDEAVESGEFEGSFLGRVSRSIRRRLRARSTRSPTRIISVKRTHPRFTERLASCDPSLFAPKEGESRPLLDGLRVRIHVEFPQTFKRLCMEMVLQVNFGPVKAIIECPLKVDIRDFTLGGTMELQYRTSDDSFSLCFLEEPAFSFGLTIRAGDESTGRDPFVDEGKISGFFEEVVHLFLKRVFVHPHRWCLPDVSDHAKKVMDSMKEQQEEEGEVEKPIPVMPLK